MGAVENRGLVKKTKQGSECTYFENQSLTPVLVAGLPHDHFRLRVGEVIESKGKETISSE